MSKKHTLLEDFGPVVIHTLLEGTRVKKERIRKRREEKLLAAAAESPPKLLASQIPSLNSPSPLSNKFFDELRSSGVLDKSLGTSRILPPKRSSTGGGSLGGTSNHLGGGGGGSSSSSSNPLGAARSVSSGGSTNHSPGGGGGGLSGGPPNHPPGGGGGGLSGGPPNHPPGGIGKYLLGIGAAGAAGAYALRDKLGDAADEAGEHINSLRDKLAGMLAAHQEA